MAGAGEHTRSWTDAAQRARPYVVAAVAVALIALFPARHTAHTSGAQLSASTPSTVAPAAAGPGEVDGAAPTGGAASPSTPSGPTGATGPTALTTRTTAPTKAGTAATGAAVRANTNQAGATSNAAAKSAGIGTPEALAAPDCEAATKKLKVSFTWRPACVIPWAKGADNGGATSMGVTADKIKVVLYNNNLGNPPTTSNSDMAAKWQTSIELFQHFYRMWGRTVENIVVDETGADEVSQRADAIKIANMKPFAAMGVPSNNTVIVNELANRGIVVVTDSNAKVKTTSALAPFVWGTTVQPDELVELNAAMYVGRRLLNQNAHWAGQVDYQALPRKFALIHPDTWDMKIFNDAFAKFGGKLADEIGYQAGQGNASTWAERSRVIAAKLKDEGITTVIAATDLLFTGPMTQAAASQNWLPEWVTTGLLAQDLDLVAATYNQAEWQHAFGVAGIPVSGKQPWPEDWFYNWYWGSKGNQDGTVQAEAPVLFAGIHGAGPLLTPQTFRDGVFSLPPAGGPATGGVVSAQYSFGKWGFAPWDDYNAFNDFDEV